MKNQKGFIQIPLLIAIIVASISAASVGTGAILYKQEKTPYFTADISKIIYKTVYEKEFEMERLKQEAELSKTKKEIAEKYAQEEIVKRTEAEVARGEAEKITREETTKRIQEEKARKEAEERAQEEAIKRANEEAKRAKEELERKIAEQKLSEKEAEEKRMNADNDGDGLTLRQEEQKGTSDLDLDSDDDGINDGEDSHPAGDDRLIAQHFEWSYGDENWTWDYSFPSDWHDYYKNKIHGSHSVEYVTGENIYIKEIAKMLEKEADNNNYTKSEFAAAFIQSLGYVSDEVIGYDDYPKYPLETLAEQNGDCEDTSYLAASIIDAMDIDCVLVILPQHMAIAVAFSGLPDGYYYPLSGRNYYYIETTKENSQIGELPDIYEHTSATLLKIFSGEATDVYPKYKKPCYASSDFSGYYSDGSNYYSDSQCNNSVHCMPYKEFYINPQITTKFYWDSGCSQEAIIGCYKSETYSGKFYKSGSAWYYDSECSRLYQSMDCDYPSFWDYTCTSESSYNSKKSNCDYYKSSEYFQNLAEGCDEELAQCRRDIDEYQREKNEYDQCKNRREY